MSPIANPDRFLNSSDQGNQQKDSDQDRSTLTLSNDEQRFNSSTPKSKSLVVNIEAVEKMYKKINFNQEYPSKTYKINNEPILDIEVKLKSKNLWDQFNEIGNEMIITKFGRCMFPIFKISVAKLEPQSKYILLLDIIPSDNNKYKYNNSKWNITNDKIEPHSSTDRFYIHPDSPATGIHWMKKDILFRKVKVTNNLHDKNGYIILNSMHKYIIRLHVVKTNDLSALQSSHYNTFSFNETKFTAITAYQNDKVSFEIQNFNFDVG